MNSLYDLMVFIFTALFGVSAFVWINILVFILVSKFINGNLSIDIKGIRGPQGPKGDKGEVQVDVPYGNKGSTSPEQEKEITDENDGDGLVNSSYDSDEFKENFINRINKLKREQVVKDGVFSYDENVESKIREALDKLENEIGDDLPTGVEIITNEYEQRLENKS